MANDGSVNAKITDSVAVTNFEVLANSPAVATAYLYQATAQALANAAHNGTQAQQAGNTVLTAVSSAGSALVMAQAPKS